MIARRPSPRGLGHLALALALLPAATAGAAPGGHVGRVLYTTRQGAYLDAGLDAGLKVGARLKLRRGKRRAGSCVVSELSAARALCHGEGLAVGDRFLLDRKAREAARKHAPPVRPSRPGPITLQRVARARLPRVRFRGKTALGQGRFRFPASVTLRHRSWGMLRSDTAYNEENATLSVGGVPLGVLDAHVHTDLSVNGWSSRSSDTRYLPDRPVTFFVRELAVDARLGRLPIRISVGRFQPRGVPGLSRLDGLQAAWTPGEGALALGAYAGTLPDALRLRASLAQGAAGLFVRHHLRGKVLALRESARVGYSSTVLDPDRLDAELRASLELRDLLHLSLQGRAALITASRPGPGLDFGAVNLSFTPGERAALDAGFRYLAPGAGDPDALLLQRSPGTQRAELTARWGPTPKVQVAVRGSYDRVFGTVNQSRIAFGPDLLLRDLLGRESLLRAGYREELETLAGRVLFVAYTQALSPRARLDARASISQLAPPETGRFPVLEGGAATNLIYDLTRHLSLRAGLEVRGGDHGAGYSAHLAATGRL